MKTDYINEIKELKKQIAVSQVKTVLSANKEMLLQYWKIGRKLLEIKDNETEKFDIFSKALKKEFPKLKCFSVINLKYMQKFSSCYQPQIIQLFTEFKNKFSNNQSEKQPLALLQNFEKQYKELSKQSDIQITDEEFFKSPIASLSWQHHLMIMKKLKDYPRIFWYILNTIEHGNSHNILGMQIEAGVFENFVKNKKLKPFENSIPPSKSDFANYLLKDPYIFDFAQAKDSADQRDIREQIEKHVTDYLLDLNQGFAYAGKNVHIEIGSSDFYIDLLFYHYKLRCFVIVVINTKEFDPGDTGKLNFFMNVVNDKIKTENDNNSIGIIMCKSKNEAVVELSLAGFKQPAGVVEYELSKVIPEELKSHLPSIEEIEKELEDL